MRSMWSALGTGLLAVAIASAACARSTVAETADDLVHVEVPEVGVAFGYPAGWQLSTVEDELGYLRLRSPDGWVSCGLAAYTPARFTSLQALESGWIPKLWWAWPDFDGEYDVERLGLPVGDALVVSVELHDRPGMHYSEYFVPAGQHFVNLACAWVSPGGDQSADQLPAIAQTFESLPDAERAVTFRTRTYVVTPLVGTEVPPEALELTRELLSARLADVATFAAASLGDDDQVVVTVPGHLDQAMVEEILTPTGEVTFVPVPAELQGLVEPGPLPEGLLGQEPLLTVDEIDGAAAASDLAMDEYVVEIRLKDAGARQFDEFAQEHDGEQFAIILDDVILMAPLIWDTGFEGVVQISGGAVPFSREQVMAMAAVLAHGSLPYPVHAEVEPATMGLDPEGQVEASP